MQITFYLFNQSIKFVYYISTDGLNLPQILPTNILMFSLMEKYLYSQWKLKLKLFLESNSTDPKN